MARPFYAALNLYDVMLDLDEDRAAPWMNQFRVLVDGTVYRVTANGPWKKSGRIGPVRPVESAPSTRDTAS